MASSTVSGCRRARCRRCARAGRGTRRRRRRAAGTRRPTGRRAGRRTRSGRTPLAAIGELRSRSQEVVERRVEDRVGHRGRSLRARSGRLRVDEAAAVADRAELVLRALRVADRPAVVDQQRRAPRTSRSGCEHREEQRRGRGPAVALGGSSPIRLATRSTWRSTGISGMAEAEQQEHDDAVFLPIPGIGVSQSRASSARQVAEELERVVAALLADLAQRRLDPGRLLVGQAARPDDVDQLVERRGLDGGPVRRRAVGQPVAAPADARLVDAPAASADG